MAMGLDFLGRERWRGVSAGAIHLLGAMVGGALVGAGLGLLGDVLTLGRWRVWVVAAAALIVLVITLTRQHFDLGRPCQVPRRWTRTMPAHRRYLVWGLMLGSGLATLIPYPAYLLLPAAQLAAGPLIAGIAGGLYGLARELPALTVLVRPTGPEQTMELLPRLGLAWRRFNLLVAVAGGLALVIGAL